MSNLSAISSENQAASIVGAAYELYRTGEYAAALQVYEELNRKLPGGVFDANLALCRARLTEPSARQPINVAYITDCGFLLATCVSLHSLLRCRAPGSVYNIFIVLTGVGREFAELFEGFAQEGFSVRCVFAGIEYENFRIKKAGFHVSPAAILKFELPNLFPDIDKLLYIDGDTIINKDLAQLFAVKIDGAYAAVVEDIKPKYRYNPSMLEKLDIAEHRAYFNTGMMLLNLARLRENDMPERLMAYRRDGKNFFMDQDAFNVVFADEVVYLSCFYNFLVTLEESFSIGEVGDYYQLTPGMGSFERLAQEATVVHYASKAKPWKVRDVRHADLWNRNYLTSGLVGGRWRFGESIEEWYTGRVIVSLTSYPGRIHLVHETIVTILQQSIKPEKIILWLADSQFPEKESALPESLLGMRSELFEIKWCEDFRSYKKLIPALKAYPRHVVVTADDDILYDNTWLEGLLMSLLRDPDAVHCYRAHRVDLQGSDKIGPYKKWKRDILEEKGSPLNFFTGCGGVLYPPRALYHHATDDRLFMDICPTGDDIWFWGMAVLNGTKIRVAGKKKFDLKFVESSQDEALWMVNDQGGRNDAMIAALFERYPELGRELRRETESEIYG